MGKSKKLLKKMLKGVSDSSDDSGDDKSKTNKKNTGGGAGGKGQETNDERFEGILRCWDWPNCSRTDCRFAHVTSNKLQNKDTAVAGLKGKGEGKGKADTDL